MTELDSIKNVPVNQNGEATTTYTPPASLVGTHKLIAKYNQNNHYNNSFANANITIQPCLIPLHLDVQIVTAIEDEVKLQVNILDENNNPYSCDANIKVNQASSPITFQNLVSIDVENVSNTVISLKKQVNNLPWNKGSKYLLEVNVTPINPPLGYSYNTTVQRIYVTIQKFTSIDCTTNESWVRNNGNTTTTAVLDNDGYITCVREGDNNDYFTVCNDLVLQKGMTIEIDFMMKNSGMHGYGLQQVVSNSPNKIFVFNGTMEEKHSGGTQTTQRVATIPTNTLTTIKFEIDTDGYITLTDSNGVHTSNTAFTDSELALMQFCWKHWGYDKSFSVHRLEYY